jgi:hypothetical protein
MRFVTLAAGVLALGAAAYYLYNLEEPHPTPTMGPRRRASTRREPIVMWFESEEQRRGYLEGAD